MNTNQIILLSMLAIAIAFCYIFYNPRYLRSYYIGNILMKQANPDLFLIEIEKDINKQKNLKYKKMLLVNKTSGLICKGQWDEAIRILKETGDDIKNKHFKVLYYNNLVVSLFNIGRTDEAIRLLQDKSDILDMNAQYKNKEFQSSIKKLYALKEYCTGNYEESKKMFEELQEIQHYNIHRAVNYYYLGQISSIENNINTATEFFQKSRELGKNTYLPKLIDNQSGISG